MPAMAESPFAPAGCCSFGGDVTTIYGRITSQSLLIRAHAPDLPAIASPPGIARLQPRRTGAQARPPAKRSEADGRAKSPPPPSAFASLVGLCRLLPAPAGRWPFPTLSLQSLRRCLDPYPAVSFRCTCSLLPRRRRPHLGRHKFDTPKYPDDATSTGNFISWLQSFDNLQAPTLASPPGCTHRITLRNGQPGRLHHAYLG
jgi:hypothetical protein